MTLKEFIANSRAVQMAKNETTLWLIGWISFGLLLVCAAFSMLELDPGRWFLPLMAIWLVAGLAVALLHTRKRRALIGLLSLASFLIVSAPVVFFGGLMGPDFFGPPTSHINYQRALFTFIWFILPFTIVWFIALMAVTYIDRRTKAATAERLGFVCPHCRHNLQPMKTIVIATRHCGHCGQRVLEENEPSDEPKSVPSGEYFESNLEPWQFVLVGLFLVGGMMQGMLMILTPK